MISHNRLDDSLKWRTVGELEAGHSQAKVAQGLQGAPKVVSGCGINSKQSILSPRRRTTNLQFPCDLAAVTGRRIFRQTACKRLADTGLYARRSV
ncbi:hypothetical protein TNCV_5086161 [Trichonephila clavipes]|uniref:Uncharacterized protein n=1 Tax=Trichonephila clavipes TaxID=2585209 RepID=A0A8X6SFE4_TRICX|nr:hypothetical protein TNCV_5086161 [Trichonephila clavipes]